MVADFSKKQKGDFFNQRLLFETLGILFIVGILVLGFADYKIYQKKRQLKLEITTYKKQIEDIKNSSQTLKDEIANSNNTDYLEKIAYEQLGEQKPGEKQVIFVMPEKKAAASLQPDSLWTLKYWSNWFSDSWIWLKTKF